LTRVAGGRGQDLRPAAQGHKAAWLAAYTLRKNITKNIRARSRNKEIFLGAAYESEDAIKEIGFLGLMTTNKA